MSLPNLTLPPKDERPDFGSSRVLEMPVDASTVERTDPMDLVVLLLRRLQILRPDRERWAAYYRGEHPLPWFTEAFREAFRASFHRFASNFTQLVVDGISERLEVQGFRFLDDIGDADLWAVWQDNNLDAGSQQAHTEALIKGACYALVEPRSDQRPAITIEDCLGAITLDDPRDRRRRLAGMKCWIDDAGRLVVYLYLPDDVYTYRTDRAATASWDGWIRGEAKQLRSRLRPWTPPDQDIWPLPNPLGVVPLVPLLNRPLLDGIGRSEVDPVTSNQDAINYYRSAAFIAARKMALPQRWATGLKLEIDPATGRPKRPFVTDEGRPADIWTIATPDPDEPVPPFAPQFGQFEAADITRFVRLIEAEVWQMASVSRLPFSELLNRDSSIPQSGEGLKSSEAPLLRKVGKAQVHLGEGWEEVMRVALRAMRDSRADRRVAETIWVSPETRNEAVRTDAVVKLKAAQIIDDQTAQELIGMTPTQIQRLNERRAATPPQPPAPPADQPTTQPTPPPMGPQMSPVEPAEQAA